MDGLNAPMEGRLKKSRVGRRSRLAITDLPLRELEAFSRSRLPVLLTFFHARIAREKSFLSQDAPQFGTEFDESARDSVLCRTGLPVHATAVNSDNNIEFVQGVGRFERPFDQHPVGFIEEVLL